MFTSNLALYKCFLLTYLLTYLLIILVILNKNLKNTFHQSLFFKKPLTYPFFFSNIDCYCGFMKYVHSDKVLTVKKVTIDLTS